MRLETDLFHCDGFCQISGLVDVAAPEQRHIIGEDLQRNQGQAGLQHRVHPRDDNGVVDIFFDLFLIASHPSHPGHPRPGP